ncbi:MAG: aminopeptidase P family protein [Methanobacteriota archaeon]|nr:MAG: aminopeptidase P family protein [Euryarchaeota archaeon]
MGERVKRIFRNLNDGVDLIVFLNSVDPHIDMSFFYATGVTDGLFEGCAAWLTPGGDVAITTSALEEEAAKKSGLPLDVFRSREESTKLLKKRLAGARKIGVNASELTYAAFQRLRKLAPRAARFVDVSGAVMKARLVKDAQEVDLIQRACDIASRAFEETLPFIQSGVTEAEVASELVYRMQKNGATAPSFRTIVGSGPNGAEPHYTAGPRKIERGDMIVIDFGAQYHMYCSDITRTVVVGPPSAEQRRMHDTVARAQAAALAKMKPGAKGKSVDAAARFLIDRTKYKGRFIHGLGHSVGLAVHDPSGGLSPSSDLVLRPNMVLTNEPGIYVPGFGGVRIEDDVLVTKNGPRVLSTAPREFLELG